MEREGLVCTACGRHFQADDYFEELGELVACPFCGSFEMDIEPLPQDPGTNEATAAAA